MHRFAMEKLGIPLLKVIEDKGKTKLYGKTKEKGIPSEYF